MLFNIIDILNSIIPDGGLKIVTASEQVVTGVTKFVPRKFRLVGIFREK